MKEKILHRCSRICLIVVLGLFGYLGGIALSTALAPIDVFAQECEKDNCYILDWGDGGPPESVCVNTVLWVNCDAQTNDDGCELGAC